MTPPNITKGEWKFSTTPQPNGCPIIGANGLMVCMLAHSVNEPKQKEEALANARLICASKAMAEALALSISTLRHVEKMLGVPESQFTVAGRVKQALLQAGYTE